MAVELIGEKIQGIQARAVHQGCIGVWPLSKNIKNKYSRSVGSDQVIAVGAGGGNREGKGAVGWIRGLAYLKT